ncbi:acetoacetate decarboxylase family protein [Lentzea sp. CC55]|uniref:acetoacetate decarboxylase family protein n=1 Tax=Lentzea sp. CC55 TaxID=2884909 RepID=UPI001F25F5DD|nr:acetoacetate decarboxylase family protein [Lentzea sp. CC55]MCG8922583.1 acetoacetate decarboxylase family protein [Lentzea sp. CC55]
MSAEHGTTPPGEPRRGPRDEQGSAPDRPDRPAAEDFPPAPWDLCGQGWLTVWTAPRSAVPPSPPGVVPLTLFGRVLVVTAFVDYRPPGLLSYHELLAAVVVRKGVSPGLSITHIWVDDETSRRGARAMWAIPKQPADFTFDAGHLTARTHATAEEAPLKAPGLPARITTSVWQARNGTAHRTALRTSARVRPTRLRWHLPGTGGIGWLTAARPRLHLAVTNLRMRFGEP